MAHAQNPDLVFQRNGRVHLNRRGSQFSRLLAVEECGSAGRPWIDRVPRHSARVVATLSNRQFPLHFPSHPSPCAITFRTASTSNWALTVSDRILPHPHPPFFSHHLAKGDVTNGLAEVGCEGLHWTSEIHVFLCFISADAALLAYFYGPIGVLILCNSIFFITTALKIIGLKRETRMLKGAESRRHDDKANRQR